MCPAGTLRGRATNGTWASRANIRLGPSLQGAEKEASSLRYRGERVGTVARQPPIPLTAVLVESLSRRRF